jgi:phosphatidylserine decarboxylase
MIFTVLAIAAVLVILFWLFRIYFLRDPQRREPNGRVIVAPADGKIMAVLEVADKINRTKGLARIETFCQDVDSHCILIAIFMSPLSVHYQRVPLSGEVINVRYSPGQFKPSQYLEHGLRNEKTETLIKTEIGNIKVVQIAGIFVRRIENFLKENQRVKTCDKLGLIHFGSQVWAILPKKETIHVTVKVGDKVSAGQSIIATY